MARLIIGEGAGAGTAFPLDESEVVIGRQPGVDICLQMKDVSRSHARITHELDRWYLEDLASSNGTFVNGELVSGRMEITDQDQIAIGSYLLLVDLPNQATPRDVTIRAEFKPQSTIRSIYEHDPSTKLRFILDIARELGRNLNLDELLPLLLDRLLELFPKADRGIVLLQAGENLVVRARKSRGPATMSEKGFSRKVVERVLSEGVGIVATEEHSDPSVTIQSLGIRSFLCVPLMTKDERPLGAVQLDSFQPGRDFTEDDLHILTAIALQVTMMLENASLHSDLLEQEKIKRDLDLARLSQMVAGVAHEINNPLAFVSNNAAILQRDFDSMRDLLQLYQAADGMLAERQPELKTQIESAIEEMDLPYTLKNVNELITRSQDGLKRIQQIVEDLRDFARLDQSEFDFADLNAGVQSTLSTMKGLLDQHQVTLNLELGDVPKVECAPSRINQVIFNLVHNAVGASKAGDVITVRTQVADDLVEIHVIDTGAGMPAEVLDKVFDPFFTTKSFGKGVGLGLSLCYGIVQDHNGTIEVESNPGEGTHFTVRLPT